MHIAEIEIDKFIPLQTGGINYLNIQFPTRACVVSAQNGTGKSSLFSMLSPGAKPKPIFNKGLSRIKIESEDGDIFEICSDFSTSGHNHSFIKNDSEELNISGTTNVQQELAIEHLGWSPLIDKFIHGKYKLCSMGASERRSLFIAANPVDIAFILEFHKKISKELRVFKNQLKLLTTRKMALVDSILSDSELTGMRKENDELHSELMTIDNLILTFNQKISDISFNIPEEPSRDELYIINNISEFTDVITPFMQLKDSNETMEIIKGNLHSLNFLKNNYTDTAKILVDELNEYNTQADLNVEVSIKEYESKIEGLNEVLSKIHIDQNLPYMDPEQARKLEDSMDLLDTLLSTIRDCKTYILPMSAIESLKQSHASICVRSSGYKDKLTFLERDLKKNEKYLMEHQMLTYPSNCDRVCSLREDVESKRVRIEKEISNIQTLISCQESVIADMNDSFKDIESKLEHFTDDVITAINRVSKFLNMVQMDDYILGKRSFEEVLSNDPFSILSKIRKVMKNSLQKEERDGVLKVLESDQFKLKTLREAQLKTVEFTTNHILSKQEDLLKTNKKITDLNNKLDINLNMLKQTETHKKYILDIENIKSTLSKVMEYKTYEGALSFYKSSIKELEATRKDVSSRLVCLSTILKEQDSLITRLNDEIIPNMDELSVNIHKYNLICEQIAPDAIPRQHIRSFTNKVISKANAVLKEIWTSSIKIHKVPKDSDVTFTFKITVGDKPVPDISDCSDGQKNAIDLAFLFGIYMVTGWNKKFPLFLDEISANMSELHKSKVLEFLITLLKEKKIKQLFLIDHQATLMSLPDSEIVLLNEDTGGSCMPDSYNNFAKIL